MTPLWMTFSGLIDPSLFAIGQGGGFYYLLHFVFGARGMLYFFIAMTIVGLVLGAWRWLKNRSKNKKAKQMEAEMKGQAAATPQGVNKAEHIAKLDDLRKKFNEGLEKFNAAGKDIYSLPWYMVVGEPGSGKTEAIRHSNVGFPAGLQDELQGVGGTINMNWWFTNKAVLLDLAGRLMFGDVPAGMTSEWNEFLKLIKKFRPNCPVNGLLLVIPADSLIKDTPEEISSKSQKIAEQLETIQRILNLRFPVFVIITKSDLINGFREFFDDLDSPETQHQILGWSNPQSIDDPFNPDATDQYLAEVEKMLFRRRMLLLEDPTPRQDLSEMRFNEMDTLYDLPNSFSKIVPNLKRYLQSVFVAGEWTTKPLFMRGIYFTSSMREGAALDADLANALGLSVDALPEGRVWERERSYFLRDVFIEKIFREWGLVTKAVNVTADQRRKKIIWLSISIVSILLLILFTWFGFRSMHHSIGRERHLWVAAKEELTDKETANRMRILFQQPGIKTYFFGGNVDLKRVGLNMKVNEFNDDLYKLIQKPLRIPLIFRMIPFNTGNVNNMRKQAYRVLFDLNVLYPLVSASRTKITKAQPEPWSDKTHRTLEELIKLEADLEIKGKGSEFMIDDNSQYVQLIAFFAYLFEKTHGRHTGLYQNMLQWSYAPKKGEGEWPPEWLMLGDTLDKNQPLKTGFARFAEHCMKESKLQDLDNMLNIIAQIWPKLDNFDANYLDVLAKFLKFILDNLDEFPKLAAFQQHEEEWEKHHLNLTKAFMNMKNTASAIRGETEKIALFKTGDIMNEYNRMVSNSLQELRICMDTLALPGKAPKPKAEEKETKTKPPDPDETPDPDADPDHEPAYYDWPPITEDIEERKERIVKEQQLYFLDRDNIDAIIDLQGKYTSLIELLKRYEFQVQLYHPVALPNEIALDQDRWTICYNQIKSQDMDSVNLQLRKFNKHCNDVFATFTNMPIEKIGLILKRSNEGQEILDEEKFKRNCLRVLKAWTAVSGDTLTARWQLLRLGGKSFKRYFLFATTGLLKYDYSAQYWNDLTHTCLKSLATETAQAIQNVMPTVISYARFPLDLKRENVKELSQKDMKAIAQLLSKIHPREAFKNPTTIGGGSDTGVGRLDKELISLRTVDLGELTRWFKEAQDMTDKLYDEKILGVLICGVSIMPESGRLPFAVIQLNNEPRVPVSDIKEPTKIGSVVSPGTEIELKLFRSVGDARPMVDPIIFRGDWSSLHILHDYHAKQGSTSRDWYVTIPSTAGNLQLMFNFNRELPSVQKWPNFKPGSEE